MRYEPAGTDSTAASHINNRFDAEVLDHVFPDSGSYAVNINLGEPPQMFLIAGSAVNLSVVLGRLFLADTNRGQCHGLAGRYLEGISGR